MFYVWMLQSFGDKGLYFVFVLQSPSSKVGPREALGSLGRALGSLGRAEAVGAAAAVCPGDGDTCVLR